MKVMLWAVMGVGMLSACGDRNCQDSCRRVYDPNECGIQIEGIGWEEMIDRCSERCEAALLQPGEMGSYDPYLIYNASDPPELESDKQAAAWMDCVWDNECADLEPPAGTCAPI